MVADNGPLYAYVENFKNHQFLATLVIYNINNVYTVFLMNLIYFNGQKMCFSFKNKDISKCPQTLER